MSNLPGSEAGDRTPRWQTFFAELKRRRVFRVAAVYGAMTFVVLQLADILVPALRLAESVTAGIALVAFLGFPIALVLAWAFETTPEGVRRTARAVPGEIEQIVAEPRARRWPSGILALAGTVMLLIGGWLSLSSRRSESVAPAPREARGDAAAEERGAGGAGTPSLAVLPFNNISGDPENQPFTDGLHDDLLTQLSRIGSLKVISRTSVQEYRNTTRSVPEIAAELGVGAILEGGVQRAGDQVRINVQLIDAATDTHLWAERYTGDLTVEGIFAIQSEIAGSITEALRARLTTAERASLARPPTRDLEAYETYLRAAEAYRQGYTERNFRATDRLAARALERDSSFAQAWALRSVVASNIYWFYYDRSDSVRAAAREMAQRALALRPDLPDGHWALGQYYYHVELDYDRALEELDIARRGRPNDAEIEATIGYVLRRRGDMREAALRLEHAAQLDPRDPLTAFGVGETLTLLRRYDEAERWFKRTLELRPDLWLPNAYLPVVRIAADGDTAGARRWLEELAEIGGEVDEGGMTLVDLALLKRDPDRALAELRASGRGVANQFRFEPEPLLAGFAWSQKDDAERAAAAFDSARAELEARVAEDPSDPRYRSALGLALAGLDRPEEAIREGREGARLMPPEREAWRGSYRVYDLARIYAMTDRPGEAIERLAYLLSIPSELSVWRLRLEPVWDPLRREPGFQALLAGEDRAE